MTGPEEPGQPLIVTGTVYQSDGRTPAAGVELLVYQTDATGVYGNGPGSNEANARLRCRLKTDASGRYEVRTIRPGRYPTGGPPAHVHIKVNGAQDATFTFAESSKNAEGPFASEVSTVKGPDGLERCTRNIRLR
jgi:protocatechuate 3,4-dioxygenase beta subunit